MAAKAGKIEKELKAPDQFVSFWAKVGKQVEANGRILLLGLGATIALVLIIVGARAFMNSRAEKASQAFAKIQRVAGAPVVAEGKPPEGSDITFKTDKERSEAALKEVDAFVANFGGSSLRDEAELQRGRLLIALGRAGEAATVYSGLIDKVDARFAFLASEGLAYAQETAGETDKAIATLTTLADKAKGAGNFYRDRALFNKARLLEAKGSRKEAETIYRAILSEMPQTTLKEDINNRLATLESK